MAFNNLSTEIFRKRLLPAAKLIYQQLFPGSQYFDLRPDGERAHALDKNFGIDAVISMPDGSYVTLQEKYRDNMFLINNAFKVDAPIPDFTQEYKNACGTPNEENGEWFHLAAQLYFYGWSNIVPDFFDEWMILDILKYKMIVYQSGGLHNIGKLQKNRKHGAASFYCIPLRKIKNAIIYASQNLHNTL